MELSLVVHSVDNQTINGMDRKGNSYTLEVKEPWLIFLRYIEDLMEISVKFDNNKIDENGYLILEPHYLIATTTITEAISCVRKVYVNTMGASDIPEKRNLIRMVEGNAIHNVFSLKLTNSDLDHQQMVDIVIDKVQADLVTLNIDEDHIRDYLDHDGKVFSRFVALNGITELDCQNWKYGVHGKFDGLVRNSIIELKSSKIPESKPWDDHNVQINIYREIMSDRGEYKGSVYYVRDGKMVPRKPYNIPIDGWLIARNWAYLTIKGKYLPKILRGSDARACNYCFKKNGCRMLCASLNDQRDCNLCTHDTICDKKQWDTYVLSFYERMSRALFAEEHEGVKGQKMMSRAGTDDKSKLLLIERGYALRTTSIITVEHNDGYFEIHYEHSTGMNRFRKGDFVQVYDTTNTNNIATLYFNAIIKSIKSDEVVLLSMNMLPKSAIITSSNSIFGYRASRRALFFASNSDNRLFDIINKKIIDFQPIKSELKLNSPLKKYNDIQKMAIAYSLSTPDIFLIQGPAGTGKTSVIVEIVNQLFMSGKRIIISAFTNMAIDNVGIQLKSAGIPFIRLGSLHSTNMGIEEYHITNRKNEYATAIENNLPIIILSTTSNMAKDQYVDLMMDYVILDEAAQMTAPECMKTLLHGEKAIFVGDHKQLQPIIISDEAKKLNLHISLFEDLVQNTRNRHILLKDQYRMNDAILEFPNKTFYNGELRSANTEVGDNKLRSFRTKITSNDPYQVISINDAKINPGLQINKSEASVVVALIRDILEHNSDLNLNDIGVITPFRAQVAELRSLIPNISIDTVDRYQGSEREVIIFSTITTANVPILSDPRRLNVALTRAKKKLAIIISNPHPNGMSLINQVYRDAKDRGLLTTISQLRNNEISNSVKENINYINSKSDVKVVIDTYDPYFDISDIIGSNSKIYYNTILLMENTTDDKELCHICKQYLDFGIQCIACEYWFHKDHLELWVADRENCPICRVKLVLLEY